MTTTPTVSPIHTVGGLLPADTLATIGEGDGLKPADYHLVPGETLREAANRAWQRLLGGWRLFQDAREALPSDGPATSLTRERWLLPLFSELGYGRLPTTPAGGLLADDEAFPVSHIWGATPIHLLGAGTDLDTRSTGVAGAARAAPHAMVQELLNRTDSYLWAILSNGRTLRLLRDNASLVRQAYVEFDLEAIFGDEMFSEFVTLYLVCHQSRVEVQDDAGPPSCWLEQWRTASVAAGTRALDQLRAGVVQALRCFGSGYLRHPNNAKLRADLASGALSPPDYYRALLRLVYRLLFVFVAEDRGLLHPPGVEAGIRARYLAYFSTSRLRRLASRRGTADRHPDLGRALQLVFGGLGNPDGLPALGLPYLGSFLFDPASAGPLATADITNLDLLAGLRSLALVRDRGGLTRNVDYRNLDSEELGSVYESLLELVPRHDPATGEFRLDEVAGNERKTTGSYYTPTSLIACLLDTALDPLLDQAVKSSDIRDEVIAALLAITVCDPACGSGHFLVAAARRIAKRLAAVRTEDPEPAPEAVHTALRDVIGGCIYGVDVNALAAELAKVSLWLEALEPGKPLTFLDAHIKVGDSLLGTTPALLAAGIPDAAFAPLTGDDKKFTAALKKRNHSERANIDQGELFDLDMLHAGMRVATANAAEIAKHDDESFAGVEARADAWRHQEASVELAKDRRLADAWCAAFVWPKHRDAPPAITNAVLRRLERTNELPVVVGNEVDRLARDYRFFHWHLEFPDVFTAPEPLMEAENAIQGWCGGFSCVAGNVPWERVKLQEQEFFATRDPDIAQAPNAAARRTMIQALVDDDPTLSTEFEQAKRRAEGESHLLRKAGRHPLCGRGDINTYAVFAETDRILIDPHGRIGVIAPTGIATDATTQYFFRDVIESSALASLYDFENRQPLFEKVDSRFKFCLLTLAGSAVHEAAADFAFFCHDPADLVKPDVRFSLTPNEITLLNPNTGSSPIFRSRRDAELLIEIYRRIGIMVKTRGEPRNEWGIIFHRQFDMSLESELFALEKGGDVGWEAVREGKMTAAYNYRSAHIRFNTRNATRGQQAEFVTSSELNDPYFEPEAYLFAPVGEVARRTHEGEHWHATLKRVTASTNHRTLVACICPAGAISYTLYIIRVEPALRNLLPCLVANFGSFIADFIVRQKTSQPSLTVSVLSELSILGPEVYRVPTKWLTDSLGGWIRNRVLELSYNSWDMELFARDMGRPGTPYQWNGVRREVICSELDAAFFHLYGIERVDVDYILDTFLIIRRKDEAAYGEYRTKRLILEVYDAMTTAIEAGTPYQTVLDPPPGQGARHPER
jgi:hypothetical protein